MTDHLSLDQQALLKSSESDIYEQGSGPYRDLKNRSVQHLYGLTHNPASKVWCEQTATMRRSIRHALSTVVGLGVMTPVVIVGGSSLTVLVAIPFIYGATTALMLDNLAKIQQTTRGDSRKLAMIGGGISAGSTTGLLQQSVAVGIVGFGLLLFGIVLVIADPLVVVDTDSQ